MSVSAVSLDEVAPKMCRYIDWHNSDICAPERALSSAYRDNWSISQSSRFQPGRCSDPNSSFPYLLCLFSSSFIEFDKPEVYLLDCFGHLEFVVSMEDLG
jgi:hypothetical protein